MTDDRLQQIMGDGWLTGWKAITSYCGLHVATCRRYKKRFGFPIRHLPDGKPCALRYEIDAWLVGWSKRTIPPPAGFPKG